MFIRNLIIISAITFLASCSNNIKKSDNSVCPALTGDGSSKETAVNSALNNPYVWLQKNYPNNKVIIQSLTAGENGNMYDLLVTKNNKDERKDFWFSLPNQECLNILKKKYKTS